MTNRDWRYLLFLLLAHHPKQKLDHTLHLSFRNKHLYLCTRCTGIAFGFISIWGSALFGFTLPLQFYVPLISVLPVVAVADWFTQSAKLRQSRTWLRLGSGYLLGISESLGFLLLFTGFYFEFLLVVGVAAVYALAVFLIASRTRCLDAYVTEMNEF